MGVEDGIYPQKKGIKEGISAVLVHFTQSVYFR